MNTKNIFKIKKKPKGDLAIEFIARPKLNTKNRREIVEISKEIKAGKNLSPSFDRASNAVAYLKSP